MRCLILVLAALAAAVSAMPGRKHFGPNDDTRIMWGTETTIEEYPHMAALKRWGSFICGASVISSTDILTAAHCVHGHDTQPSRFTVSLGHTRYDSGRDFSVRSISKHPQYNPSTIDNDVAVLNLATPITFSDQIRSVKLDMEHHDNGAAEISGWGKTESGSISRTLRKANVDVISSSECMNQFWPGMITAGMMCATDLDQVPGQGEDVCSGDSGSPLVMREVDNTMLQVGVVSWGRVPCILNTDVASVYARVSHYHDWINSQMTTPQL